MVVIFPFSSITIKRKWCGPHNYGISKLVSCSKLGQVEQNFGQSTLTPLFLVNLWLLVTGNCGHVIGQLTYKLP
jgi:hypothetical protein